jgi:spore coat protein U-like protein
MKTIWAACLAISLVLLGAVAPACAQSCNFTIGTVNFGNIDLTANTSFNTSSTFSASCTGTANTTVRVCPNLDTGSGGSTTGNPRFLLNGGSQLNYNLYQDSGYATVWGSNLWAFAGSYGSPTIDIPLNGSGTGSGNATIYALVWSGQQTLPGGAYTSAFSGTQASVAYAYSTVGTCAAIGSSHATAAPFNVSATDQTVCSLSTSAVNFPATGVLLSSVDATGAISVTCTSGASYTVALDGGTTGATNPTQRKMAQGAEQITYGLYQNSGRTLPWGDTSGGYAAAGSGSGLSQNLTVYGRVPAQNTPSAGTYMDTVVVTLSY